MFFSVVLGTLICISISDGKIRDLPLFFPRCHRSDPLLNECLLNAVSVVKDFVRKGVKEIGMPPMEKYTIPYCSVLQYNPVYINGTANNFTFDRLDTYNFQEVSFDTETLTLSGKIRFEEIYIENIYEIDAYLLTRIIGQGTLKGLIGPTLIVFEITGKLVEKEEVYYSPLDCKVIMTIDGFNVNMEGLLGPKSPFAESANELLNNNSNLISALVSSALEKVVERLFLRYITYLTSNIPYDKLLPL